MSQLPLSAAGPRAAAAPGAGAAWWRPAAPPAPREAAGAVAIDAGPGDSRVAFGALVAFTLVLLLAPQLTFPALAVLRPAFLAAAVAVLAHVGYRLMAGEPIAAASRETWLAGGLLAWAVVTVPASLWPGGSAAVLLDVYGKSLLIFWLLPSVVNTPGRLRRFTLVLALAAAPLGVTAMRNYAAGAFIQGAGALTRITGYDAPLTQNPNDLALMLNLLLPLAVALLLCRAHPALRLALLATVALGVVGVILTFSRAGFLALAVVAGAWLWNLRRRPAGRRAALALVALGIAALPLLPAGYTERLATVTDTRADATGSAQARWADTLAALRFVGAHPIIGAGLGQDVLALNAERGNRWTSVHNVYLQYAVDLGLPGLALFALVLGGAFRAAAGVERAAAARGADDLATMAAGVRISLLAFAVSGLFHPAGYHFYFFYVGGLALALRVVWTRVAAAAPDAPAVAAGAPPARRAGWALR